MAKTIARLFRDPESAQKAVGELLAQGYTQEEIGLLLRLRDGRRLLSLVSSSATQVNLSRVGQVSVSGALAQSLAADKEEAEKALMKVLEASPEAYTYYETGLSVGGVLVTVHGEEVRLAPARRLLRSAPLGVLPIRRKIPNPGFDSAARMSATDPLDAKMTGDFRRY